MIIPNSTYKSAYKKLSEARKQELKKRVTEELDKVNLGEVTLAAIKLSLLFVLYLGFALPLWKLALSYQTFMIFARAMLSVVRIIPIFVAICFAIDLVIIMLALEKVRRIRMDYFKVSVTARNN